MIPIVKICGITSTEDALAAVDAGADALGLMFYEPSPRCLTIGAAAEICGVIPAQILKVGVFVDAGLEFVHEAIADCGLNVAQFHGHESPEFCSKFPVSVWKAFRVRDAGALEGLPQYQTDAWLLDSYVKGRPGGTGETFNWDLAATARGLGRPLVLAGGLNEGNVAEAVRVVSPYGLDVSSGVEMSPGRKDPVKMRAFVRAAKAR